MNNDLISFKRNKFYLVLGLVLLFPALADATGLGRVQLSSGLGEPLSADIELLEATPEELSSIVARVATKDEYAKAGLQDTVAPTDIRISVVRGADGQHLHLASIRAIDDPFLELLIYLDSDNTHLARQYTLLLDPPALKSPAVVAEAAPASQPAAPSAEASEPVKRKTVRAPAAESSSPPSKPHKKKQPPPPASEPATENSGSSYTIKPGDILGRIAQRHRPQGVSLHDAINAFYKNNPQAFIDGDMDKLKVGEVLQVPAFDAASTPLSQLEESKPASEAEKKPMPEPKQASTGNKSGFVLHIGTEGMSDNGTPETKQNSAPVASTAAPVAEKPVPSLPETPTAAGPTATNGTDPASPVAAPQPAPAPKVEPMPAAVSSNPPLAGDSLVDRLMWIGLGVLLALAGMLGMSFYNSRRAPTFTRRY